VERLTFRKRTLVTGVRATGAGYCNTDRGAMKYDAGDWLLTTTEEPVQTWPVSQEYLDANYEVVEAVSEEEVPDGETAG
jgi:hypothetical protein